MAIKALAALTVLLISTSVHAVPSRTCQQLGQYALEHQPSQLCVMADILKQLGCLCGDNIDAVRLSSPDGTLDSLQSCFREANEQDLCSITPLPDLIKKYAVFGVPGVVSLPGFGMLLVSALQDVPVPKGSLKLQSEEVSADLRPVLDLSNPVDIFESELEEQLMEAIEEDSASTEVVMTESKLASGDVAFNIDIGIPKSFLEAGGELDLENSDVADDMENTYDSDLELDLTFSSGVKQPISGKLGKEFGSLHLETATLDDRDLTQGTLDFNILPVTMGSDMHSSEEVTIEMDIEIDAESHIHDAVITVRDEDSKYPITGLEVGSLLTEISHWLIRQLPSNAETVAHQDSVGVQSALRGVSKLLSDVGEQIGEILPDQELYNGQTLEIIAEEQSELAYAQDALESPCMFKALAQAAASVMSLRSKTESQEKDDLKCKLCSFVDKHLAVFWCIVVLGTLYVTYTLLLSFYYYLNPNNPESSVEVDDLQKPLILYASDFAELGNGKEGFEPYCGPITDKPQVPQ